MTAGRASFAHSLFGRTRDAVVGLLFAEDGVEMHGREIARRARIAPQTIAEELAKLLQVGVIRSRVVGTAHLYSANRNYPYFDELQRIARKTVAWGVPNQLREYLAGLQGVRCAFIFGSIAKGTFHAESDVDVLVIGDVDYEPLMAAMTAASAKISRPVNAKLYREGEWRRKLADKNRFVVEVNEGPKKFLIGDEATLDGIKQPRKPGEAAQARDSSAPEGGDRGAPADGEGPPQDSAAPRRPR
jgi:predicted nucleotidyltransferase